MVKEKGRHPKGTGTERHIIRTNRTQLERPGERVDPTDSLRVKLSCGS